jgi:cytochrome c oxidase subunit 2
MPNSAAAVSNGHVPMDYFMHGFGPAAGPVMALGHVFAAICIAVCLIVALLLVIAIGRKRPGGRADDVISGGDGLKAVYAGVALSTLVLLGMGVYMLWVFADVASPPSPPALTIAVTGYDWWWEAVYDADDPARRFATANEIHIPVGRPVLFQLKSADVIHAFWVPQLAGKTQMIPGLVNRQWLQADRPGVYRGQCTQFCGIGHARMAFEIVAQAPEDFARWEAAQRAPHTGQAGAAGERVFMARCAACHAVRGTEAAGGHAPDLTHLMARRMLAAGQMENTPGNLMRWVTHAQAVKPGTRMPDIPLPDRDKADLAAYLETLQ